MNTTSTLEYIKLLEMTNQQLALWTSPYAVLGTFLSVVIAVLAIAFAFVLWRQSRDYKEFLERQERRSQEELEKTKNYLKIVLDDAIAGFDGKLKDLSGQAKAEIEKEIISLKSARESLSANQGSSFVDGISYGPSLLRRLQGGAKLSETQIQSILALLNSFGADQQTIASVERSLRGR